MGLNLLFFTRRLTVGGCQISAVNLAAALVSRGHRVTFIADEGPLVDQVRSGGMDFVRTRYDGRKHPSIQTAIRLAHQTKKLQVDLIQAFDPYPIIEAYGSQLLHTRPVYGLVAAQPIPTFRIPKSREIALVNPDTRQRYIQLLGWAPDRLSLVVARLDCDRYKPLNVAPSSVFGRYGVDGSLPIVTLVTRVDTVKWSSIEFFLSAARHWLESRSQVMPVQFAVVGGGPLLPRLRERIDSLEMGRLLFATGELLEIPQVMNASAIVVGMASTCQQAMACGKPVIVLGNGGFSAVSQPDNIDFLSAHHFNLHQPLDDEQPERMGRQIEEILASPMWANKLREFGRAEACERFDSEIGARQLEKTYYRLLEHRATRLAERAEMLADLSLSLGSLYAYRLRRRLARMLN